MCKKGGKHSFHPETIPDTQSRHEMARLSRIGFDLIPQLTHIHTHIVSLFYMEGTPHFFEQLAMRDCLWELLI